MALKPESRTDIHTQINIHTDRHIQRQTYTDTDRHIQRQTYTQSDIHTDRDTQRQTYTDMQICTPTLEIYEYRESPKVLLLSVEAALQTSFLR